ncbi:ribosomal protein L22e [Syncephalis fuscata]|nr:ribosomal protein L22e [Syncephalis fuscata]
MPAIQKTKKVKKTPVKVVIDCSAPADDKLFDVAAFEKFLHDRVKVSGRTGNFGEVLTIARQGAKITLNSTQRVFPKRYIKYLVKKFLKKNQLRDWLRVIATDRTTYELRYFNIASQEDEEDDEDDEE